MKAKEENKKKNENGDTSTWEQLKMNNVLYSSVKKIFSVIIIIAEWKQIAKLMFLLNYLRILFA